MPRSQFGTFMSYGSAYIFYSEDILTGTAALFYIHLGDFKLVQQEWARRIFIQLDNIPKLVGESVVMLNNSKIVAYGGMAKEIHSNLKVNLRTSLRIFDLGN